MSIQTAFGLVRKELRNQIGLSQEKFALKIGMDRIYYASVESGKRNISLANIEKIAAGLGVTLTELFSQVEKYISEEDSHNYLSTKYFS